jgi:hypothetical protein
VCFRVWEGGFESNNNNEMVARRAIATTIMKLQYEATIDLSFLAMFVAFVAFSSHLTIGKESNQ